MLHMASDASRAECFDLFRYMFALLDMRCQERQAGQLRLQLVEKQVRLCEIVCAVCVCLHLRVLCSTPVVLQRLRDAEESQLCLAATMEVDGRCVL
jgi:hypothetical protein